MPNFSYYKLAEAHNLARVLQLSYSLHYNEGSDTWYASINEVGWVGKDHSFEIAVDCLFEQFETIKESTKDETDTN